MSYTQGTSHQNTAKLWDKLLHEAVQNKDPFAGMEGEDKGGESSLKAEVANKPFVRKTQLGKESGDQITMGLVANVGDGSTWYNEGKVANETLAGSEDTLAFYNSKVRVAHFRKGVSVTGKNTLQRSPYSLLSVAKERVSTTLSRHLTHGRFFAFYNGVSPNVVRELGSTAAAPALHINNVYGKDKADLASMDATDILDFDLIERLRVAVEEANINPIVVDGERCHLLLCHPRGGKTLRSDSAWKDAQQLAAPRSEANAMFRNTLGFAAGIFVKEANDVDTAKAVASTSGGTAGDITWSADTVGFGAATDFRMNILIGANAMARAIALEPYMARRKDDDYENIYGFAGGLIYGDRRADFLLSADTGTDGARKNQSSAIVYTYSPNVNSNFTFATPAGS